MADPENGSYAIRADVHEDASIGSVQMELAGAGTVGPRTAVTRTENVVPYSLYGDGGENALHGGPLAAGSYVLRATAYRDRSLGGEQLSAIQVSFTIRLSNSPPEFDSPSYDFSITDYAAVGEQVGSVLASDPDDDSLSYAITSGNEDHKFAIDGGSGAITVAGTLDHKTTPSYTLTVQADDDNGGTAAAAVNITVSDGNTAPTFESSSYDFNVAEDAATGAAVGRAFASDADGDRLTYKIIAGNQFYKFALEAGSGAITVAGTLDHVTTPSYTLTVQVDDGKGGRDTVKVNILVVNVNGNTPPVFKYWFYDFYVAKDAAMGAALGSVVAGDADGDSLTYSFASGNWDQNFAIEAGSGAINVAGTLDDLTASPYTMTVQADDGNGGTATTRVIVTVVDGNFPPQFEHSLYDFYVAEDAAVGTVIGTVSATDEDDDVLTYTITGERYVGKFEIDTATGAISALHLDHETMPFPSLVVKAGDGNGAFDYAHVFITVTDVKGNTAPRIESGWYDFVVAEDAPVGSAVGSVVASDSDGDTLTYTLVEGNGDQKFAVSDTGDVTTEGLLDYETAPHHLVTLQVDDGNGSKDTATLNITVRDVEENNAPEFGSASYDFSIAEDASTGAAVGTVSANDADNDGITYNIEAGNGDGVFAVDGSTGAITTAGALDHETTPSYTLTVQADDDNGGTATAAVNISVTDVDESSAGPLTGFTLVDAADQTVLATLSDGGSVALADPDGGSYGIRANVDSNASIGSVKLELTGEKAVTRTENISPYSLYGDGGANALNGEALPAGNYTLTATAHADSNLNGDQLGTLEVSFTITAAN